MSQQYFQFALDLCPKVSTDGHDFYVSQANEKALKLIKIWPNWPSRVQCLSGDKSSGKTHLGKIWQKVSGARYVSASQKDAIEHILKSGIQVPLIVDDLELIEKDETLESLFFHLINFYAFSDSSLLFLSAKMPSRLKVNLKDLKSRLSALPLILKTPAL